MKQKKDVEVEKVLVEVRNLVAQAVAIEREACAVEVELRLLGHHLGPIIAAAIRRRENEAPRDVFEPIQEVIDRYSQATAEATEAT